MPEPRDAGLDLVFWLPAINPYWARRLRALHESGTVAFECWFNTERGAGREWIVPQRDLTFPHIFLPQGPRRYVEAAKHYRRTNPQRLMTFHFDPRLWPSYLHALMKKRELAIYVEKTWDSWVTRRRTKEALKHLLLRIPQVAFVPGADAHQYVSSYRGGRSYRQLPHVVDLEFLEQARSQRSPVSKIRFLYLGRLIREKGLHDMTSAFDRLPEDIRSSCSLAIVGSGPLSAELDQWAARTSLDVRRQEFVQAEDIPPILADADALLFPTLGDPYGLVVNEALASGMAVISTTSAGEIEERLGADSSKPRGLLVPPGDPNALAAAIESFIRDRTKLTQCQASAERFADAQFSLDRWVGAIENWCASNTRKRGRAASPVTLVGRVEPKKVGTPR